MEAYGTAAGLQKVPLYEQVANLLESQILNQLEDGDLLPSEQQLAEQFLVSRTIIREAQKLLKERGLLDSKAGKGTYVKRLHAQDIAVVFSRLIRMERIDYISVFDMRNILEVEAVARASQNATPEELEKMAEMLDKLKEPSLSEIQYSEYDFSFHYMIAKASGNPLLAIMTEAIGSLCRQIISRAVQTRGGVEDALWRHELILKMLYEQNEAGAREAMRGHLDKSLENYQQYLEHLSDEQKV